MGLLDRFKKGASDTDSVSPPDAYTREVAIRVRALPTVASVDLVDADHLSVRWNDLAEPVEVSIAAHRGRWQSAAGFGRIEVVDDIVAELQTPPATVGGGDPVGSGEAPTVAGRIDEAASAVAPAASDAAVPSGSDWAAVRDRLRPVLLVPDATRAGTIRWPVAELLEAAVVVDDPRSIPIGEAEVAGWGVDVDEVRRTAIANLEAHDPGLDAIGEDTRAWVPTAPEGFQASWLAAADRLLEAAGLARAVVFVPTPTDLVVVDPADAELLGSLTTSTLAIVEQEPVTICPVPFEIRPGTATPWDPGPDHGCAPLVDRARAAFGSG